MNSWEIGVFKVAQKKILVPVVPAILKGFREDKFSSLESLAEQTGISEEDLIRMEDGSLLPTYTQLESLAFQFNRPVVALLLDRIPQDPRLTRDNRLLSTQHAYPLSSITKSVIRLSRKKQDYISDFAQSNSLASGVIGSLSIATPLNHAASYARKLMQLYTRKDYLEKDSYAAFRKQRGAVERLGIFVLQQEFPLIEARGFYLSSVIAPMIVINKTDNILARRFTLAHEFAHALIDEEAISDAKPSDVLSKNQSSKIEHYCNLLAAEILMPIEMIEYLINEYSKNHENTPIDDLGQLTWIAKKLHVSNLALAVRLSSLERINREQYGKLQKALKTIAQNAKKKTDDVSDIHKPSAEIQCRRLNGEMLIRFVKNYHSQGLLTSTQAARILDVHPNTAANIIFGTG